MIAYGVETILLVLGQLTDNKIGDSCHAFFFDRLVFN